MGGGLQRSGCALQGGDSPVLCANGTRRASLSRSSGNVLLSPLPNHIQKVFWLLVGYRGETGEQKPWKREGRRTARPRLVVLHSVVGRLQARI